MELKMDTKGAKNGYKWIPNRVFVREIDNNGNTLLELSWYMRSFCLMSKSTRAG